MLIIHKQIINRVTCRCLAWRRNASWWTPDSPCTDTEHWHGALKQLKQESVLPGEKKALVVDRLNARAGNFGIFLHFFTNKKWFFCIFYQVNKLFLHQSYLESHSNKLEKKCKQSFLLLKIWKIPKVPNPAQWTKIYMSLTPANTSHKTGEVGTSGIF